MPTITINGKKCEFKPGQMILQAATAGGVEIPQYCYHDGLSIVASCRICLGEVWAPNARNNNKLEPYMGGKLMPTCQTPAADGMVVHTDSPKATQNQKSVMEYLLINHPLDCPVCDQAGECFLQDYSYQYGRSVSRFEEDKVKQPKKDIGPHVYLYADRCIMCSRCVRFTREVSGTGELGIMGRGNKNEIDVFPGVALDNPLASNVIDLCPVGALLDKDFLFVQRVWFLKETPSIDPLTAGGDNISIHHNEGRVYRIKPRDNPAVNKWWITDEVRYGWKFVHSEDRLRSPVRRQYGAPVESDFTRAYEDALEGLRRAVEAGGRLALVVSPMLTCEEAFALAEAARAVDEHAVLAVGPVPVRGKDEAFPKGISWDDPKAFRVYAEKAPNARGVRRVLEALSGGKPVLKYEELLARLEGAGSERASGRGGAPGSGAIGAVILTGNYPDAWPDDRTLRVFSRAAADRGGSRPFLVLIDTLSSRLVDEADIVLPGATWAEKAGTFENARNMLQAFEQAIPVIELAKPEGQIALDLFAMAEAGDSRVEEGRARAAIYNAADVRRRMAAAAAGLEVFVKDVKTPHVEARQRADMEVVEL